MMAIEGEIEGRRYATTTTCITERPTLEVGKCTGTVQRPHWGDSSPSILMERKRLLLLDTAQKLRFPCGWAAEMYFPLLGDFWPKE